MELRVRNMVCGRCIKMVAGIFREAGIQVTNVELGVVVLKEALTTVQEPVIRKRLEEEGFALLEEQKTKLVAHIKQLIVELVHYSDLEAMKENLSGYLAKKMYRDYNYLSNLFSATENTTIEQYFILQKIEKVKEWLVYDEFTLSEIAFKMGYSSVAHLSRQFKTTTGFTPSAFKKLKDHQRKHLDKL